MKKRAFLSICLSAPWMHCAVAAPAVELKVIGMIKPAACELIFANGGTVDLGVISKRLLNPDKRTLLADEKINFSINCDAPALVALDIKDGRVGTAATSASSKGAEFLFGLGRVNAKNVGAYTMSIEDPVTADQKPARLVAAHNQTDWRFSHPFLIPNRRHGWTAYETIGSPTPFSQLIGIITLAAAVVPARDLTSQDEIAIDGMASFELNYL